MTKFFENRNDEVGTILTANFKISADATGVSPRMTAGAFQVSQFFFSKTCSVKFRSSYCQEAPTRHFLI